MLGMFEYFISEGLKVISTFVPALVSNASLLSKVVFVFY